MQTAGSSRVQGKRDPPAPPRPAGGPRLIVVANRLPVSPGDGPGDPWRTSPGGLVSALLPILREVSGSWIGWPGAEEGTRPPENYEGIRLEPVALTRTDVERFYEGFSNRTLWPLYHDAVRWPEFHRSWWWPYVDVNQRYAAAAARAARPGDLVWVHDYHLQLVPALLRKLRPDVRIGFFLHVPFPPVELFAQIPWRVQLLEGLLGADLVGFQTEFGARNFQRAVRRFLPVHGARGVFRVEGREVRVGAFPISIDCRRFADLAATESVQRQAQSIRESLGVGRKLILGVDRLDYTKGIDHRLRAFETVLRRHDQSVHDVVFLQLAVPTRELVPDYMQIRTKVEQQVGHVNGRWGTPEYVPVHYMYRNLPPEELVAHYVAADVMAVTPLRDGMNLVAKEYVTTRLEHDGVLVLSEFAGAARELKQALLVNPHDIDGMAAVLDRALRMPGQEQRQRMATLRRNVVRNDVHLWASTFVGAMRT